MSFDWWADRITTDEQLIVTAVEMLEEGNADGSQ